MSVKLVVGEEEFTVKRTQSPNSLKIDNTVTDNETLVKRLRLNFESFLYSIIIPQAGNSFLDLSPAEKLTLFSQIMDLDFWLEKSKQADVEAARIDTEIKGIENSISRLNGSIAILTSTIDELKIKSKEFETGKTEKVELLSNELTNNHIETKKLKVEIDKFEKEISILLPRLEAAESKAKSYEKDIKNLQDEQFEVDKELNLVAHKLTVLNESESKFKGVGSVCPTCKQIVDTTHIAGEIKKIHRELNELRAFKEGLILARNEIHSDKKKIETKMSSCQIEFNNLRSQKVKIENNKMISANEITYLDRENTRLSLEIKKTKELANEFTQMILHKRNELFSMHKTINSKETEIKQLNKQHAAIHFWVAGFKRLRLYIIEETLRTLEIEVNNNLVALGLGDWKIEFSIERENKSGGITKGFITLITDPQGYTAKYETVSQGENQRIKLAGAFGLANLIVERAGLISAFEAYDEPTEHLSDEGIEDVLNILRDRASSLNREIWIIDHRALHYGDFNGTINLIRDENGSRFYECKSGIK